MYINIEYMDIVYLPQTKSTVDLTPDMVEKQP